MGRFLVTGIDVGHHSIKAVVLKSSGKESSLVAYKEVPVTENIFTDNQRVNQQSLINILKEVKKGLPLFSRHVAISLPDNTVISKVLTIESELEEREKEFAIYQAFAHQSPIPIEELSLDFVEVEDKTGGQQSGLTYQVYATRKDVVEERLFAMKKAGFKPILVDMQAHSLQRIWQLACEKKAVDENWMLVDIGLTQTSLCSAPSDSHLFFRDIVFGTKNIEGAVEGDFTSGDVKTFLNQLAERLQKQIQLYNSVNPQRQLEGIWLSGGGAAVEDVCIELARRLNLKCNHLNPLDLVNPMPGVGKGNEQINVYCCAAGLAVEGVEWMGGDYAA